MTTARRLARSFGVVALLALCVEGAVSVWLGFHNLQADAAGDAVVLGRLAAGVMEPALAEGELPRALQRLASVQRTETSVVFGWQWLDEAGLEPAQRAALTRGEALSTLHRAGWRAHVLALVPVRVGPRLGLVRVDDDVTLHAEHVVQMGALVLLLIAVLGAAFLLAADRLGRRLVGAPVGRLIELTRAVGEGDLSTRVPAGDDELGQLSRAVNQMVDALAQARQALSLETRGRLELSERLRHADRLITVGRLSASLAHELGTPLNVVLLRAQLVGELPEEAAQQHAQVIQAQVGRMERIVRQLLGYARKQGEPPVALAPEEVAREVVQLLAPAAEARGVQLRLGTQRGAKVLVERQALEQVLSNLVMNAVQALSPGEGVTVSCEQTVRARGPLDSARPWVCVGVADDGPGLPEAVRAQLFEPFVTTKPLGSGTGLGLFVSKGLAEAWGGWLELAPSPRGCSFRCYLPLAP